MQTETEKTNQNPMPKSEGVGIAHKRIVRDDIAHGFWCEGRFISDKEIALMPDIFVLEVPAKCEIRNIHGYDEVLLTQEPKSRIETRSEKIARVLFSNPKVKHDDKI